VTRFHDGHFSPWGMPQGEKQERSGQITSYKNRTSLQASDILPRVRAPGFFVEIAQI
jgi:hypothetical protein